MSDRDESGDGIGQIHAVVRTTMKYDNAIGHCRYDDCVEPATLTVEIDAMGQLVEYPICPAHARRLHND